MFLCCLTLFSEKQTKTGIYTVIHQFHWNTDPYYAHILYTPYSPCLLILWLLLVCCWPEGKECPTTPALEEWRVCNDHPCMVFYWEASAWGPCIEDTSMNLNKTNFWNGTPTCAVGVQIRKVSCTKMGVGSVISKRYILWLWSVFTVYTVDQSGNAVI